MTPRRIRLLALLSLLGAATLVGTTVPSAQAAKKVVKPKTPTTKKKTVPTIGTATGATATPTTAVPVSTLAWTKCGEYQCASMKVPMNYQNPAAGTITVGMERIPATTNRIGSILINPGGPGGSGVRLLHEWGRKLLSADALARYDLIGFDPRGLGKSTELPCATAQQQHARSSKEYVVSVAEACKNRAAVLTDSVTTLNTARDMEEIRKALGEPKLNYLGFSYGSYLGAVYADQFPDRVGRFVIDSAVDPTVRAIQMQVQQYAQYESNLRALLAACTGACPFADPDIVGRYNRLLAKLDKAPLRHPTWVTDRRTLELLVINLPLKPGGTQLLYQMMAEFDRGDSSSMTRAVAMMDDALPDPSDIGDDVDGEAVYFAIACKEGFHPSASPDFASFFDQLKVVAPSFLRTAERGASIATCDYWGAPKSETRPVPAAKPGVPPMLFIGSVYDAVTPIQWTDTVSKQWPGSVLLKFTGWQHGALGYSNCAGAAAGNFFVTGVLPAPGTICNS